MNVPILDVETSPEISKTIPVLPVIYSGLAMGSLAAKCRGNKRRNQCSGHTLASCAKLETLENLDTENLMLVLLGLPYILRSVTPL